MTAGNNVRCAICHIVILVLLLITVTGCATSTNPDLAVERINSLSEDTAAAVRAAILPELSLYEYISIAVIRNNRIVYSASFGADRSGKRDVYASVSKPVTATIVMHLYANGVIDSLDDAIGTYHPWYAGRYAAPYQNAEITFRELLSHTSGIPHQNWFWRFPKIRLLFAPGSKAAYSSHGYGVIGDVLEHITGMSYRNLIGTIIAQPVGADSMGVSHAFFDAPAGQVISTIEDLGRFAIGVMDGTYYPKELLEEVLSVQSRLGNSDMGLGWYRTVNGTGDVIGYHAGSNGKPKAYIVINPARGNAVVFTGVAKAASAGNIFGTLALEISELF